jgi:hypothetical protein
MCRKLPSCDVFCRFDLKHSSCKTCKCASLAGGVALAKLLQERVLQQVGARQADTKLQKAAKKGTKRNVRAPSTIDELARIDMMPTSIRRAGFLVDRQEVLGWQLFSVGL